MRIVLDMQGAQTESRFRGIGRYTMSFAKAVVRNSGEHEIILALSGLFPDTIEPIRAAFEGLLPQENIRVWNAPGAVREQDPDNASRREVAELVREAFLASLRPDVIHVCSLFEGYVDDAVVSIGRFDTKTPVSVILYDLIPLLNPETYLRSNPQFESYYLRKVSYLNQASKILAISEFAQHASLAHLDIAQEKVTTISTAVESHIHPLDLNENEAAEIKEKFGISRKFIFYAGCLDESNNLTRLLKAFAALPKVLRVERQLLIVDNKLDTDTAYIKQVALDVGLDNGEVILSGFVSERELVKLYNLCQLFIFPSWHDGLGFSVLEAMACGVPVIGANASSLPEYIGLSEALFDPFDVASITQKLTQALEDDAFRTRVCTHGLRQAKKYSWDETANRAINAWEDLRKTSRQHLTAPRETSQKPTMAFVSPFPPERTGIADYSAELLPALSAYYDVELVVAQDQVDSSWVSQHVKVHDVAWLCANAHKIDRVLYHIGNSAFHSHMISLLTKIPGVVVLHDFFLGHLLSGMELRDNFNIWEQSLCESHGYASIKEVCLDPEAAKFKYPANWIVLQHSLGVITHSRYSANLTQSWYGNAVAPEFSVIPLLRVSAQEIDKRFARKQLGINENNFVVCSFGLLGQTKLNHRLLHAWKESALSNDKSCRLIFVGENFDGQYRDIFSEIIHKGKLSNSVQVTGFVCQETYRKYLAAADVAVQLRTNSRGETSAAVLDCMNYALPVIVNANGSMAELDREAVWMLPDEFSDASLAEALDVLWRDSARRQDLSAHAKSMILDHHAPDKCAKEYFVAVERFYQSAATQSPALLSAIGEQASFLPCEPELIHLAQAIALNLPLRQPAKRLFLDVSIVCRQDIKTGIQRVTRALTLELLESSPPEYRVEPVYLSDAGGVWHYRYARQYTLELLQCQASALGDSPVDPQSGDIVLVLDLTGPMMISAANANLYKVYRSLGVRCFAVIYDLLPVLQPDLFPQGSSETHENWLKKVSELDGAVSISQSVAKEFCVWQEQFAIFQENRRPFVIDWFHLGSDVSNSAPSLGLPLDANKTLRLLKARPTFLMVGTIEPRKGYLQVVEAFSELWNEDLDINLVIVGKEGWKGYVSDEHRRNIPETVSRLRSHRECNKRLFWLEGISDEYLEKVYEAGICLIAASYGEGFGLPLIEAARNNLPIIARDIPVFREVAGEYAYYFQGKKPDDIFWAIKDWLELYKQQKHPKSDDMPWLTWRESARQLLKFIHESD